MIDLLVAVVKYMQSSGSGFRPFIGSNTSGNTVSYGPYSGVAPQGTDYPYIVYDIIPKDLDQGFSFPYTSYGENPKIRWNLYSDDVHQLSANLKTFMKKMDTIDDSSFVFNNSDEECRSIYRTENPVLLHDPITKDGKRAYHAAIEYTFHTACQKGQ